MGQNKKNRSKQRKAKALERSSAAASDRSMVGPGLNLNINNAPFDKPPNLITFHPDDDINRLLDFLHKGKKIDCIKLARFLPNATKDIKDRKITVFDLFASIEVAFHRSKHIGSMSDQTARHLCDAATGLMSQLSSALDSCWQCEKVLPQNISVCGGCKVANYCSMECQLQAWKEGHKDNCSIMEGKFLRLKESIEIIEATHSEVSLYPNAKFNIFSDYCMLAVIHGSPSITCLVDALEETASIKFFYQNLARIQQGWYFVSRLSTKPVCPQTDIYFEETEFNLIAQVLSCDLLTYCSTLYPNVQCPEKMVDFLPGLTGGVSMSAERFLELYYTGQETWAYGGSYICSESLGEKADSKERWKRTRRLLKQSAIESLRRAHDHKGQQKWAAQKRPNSDV